MVRLRREGVIRCLRRSRHGNVLDEVLREEIKDLTPEQVKQVLEYIETLKQQ